jgi:hypothetical protein
MIFHHQASGLLANLSQLYVPFTLQQTIDAWKILVITVKKNSKALFDGSENRTTKRKHARNSI